MKRCPHCSAPLGWPYVEMSIRERSVYLLIMSQSAEDYTQLGRLLKCSEATARSHVDRLRKKLTGKAYILARPLRVVRVQEIKHDCYPGYQTT
jgi:DNA-binding CsgD family transcriptional regulator